MKDNPSYIKYCNILKDLIVDEHITSEKVSESLSRFSEEENLDLTNEKLITLQILFTQ